VLLKQQKVLGGYDAGAYAVERTAAESVDGVRVPMTIAYRKGLARDGSGRALLYGYGSYAIAIDPGFSASRLALLDRGFAYAIAHIRGGTDLGYSWYEDGKLLRKKNTFSDFIACAEKLVKEGYAAPERLVIEGASAGGLLVGAVMNERPELFGAVIAGVPFVDVISTLEDKSIPLSTTDIDEFGDPEREEFYHYMKTYSPYDNVGEREYPALYIYTSLNDSQVGYWEPVKWAAKLRKHQRGARKILLQVNLEAGHGGASGRYDRLRELARCYAFAIAETGAAPVDRRRA
jgi:oligopeptidase B